MINYPIRKLHTTILSPEAPMTGPTDEQFAEVSDAVSLDDLLDEIIRRRKESKPHLYCHITEEVVDKMMPDVTATVRKKIISDLGIKLWQKMAEEAHAESGTEAGTNRLGKAAFIGRISPKPKHWGKDAGAMAEVEDRREAIG